MIKQDRDIKQASLIHGRNERELKDVPDIDLRERLRDAEAAGLHAAANALRRALKARK